MWLINSPGVKIYRLNDPFSLIHEACVKANRVVLEELIRHHSDLHSYATTSQDKNTLTTTLHCAVKSSDLEMVKTLLRCGVSRSKTSSKHQTALDLARELKNSEMVDLLSLKE